MPKVKKKWTWKRAKVSKKAFIEALHLSKGNQSEAARLLGISREAVHDRVKNNPELRRLVDSYAEAMLDYAVGHIFEGVVEGKEWAIDKAIKFWGHRRGLVEKRVFTGENGAPLLQSNQIVNAQLMVLLHDPTAMKVLSILEEVIDVANGNKSRGALPSPSGDHREDPEDH